MGARTGNIQIQKKSSFGIGERIALPYLPVLWLAELIPILTDRFSQALSGEILIDIQYSVVIPLKHQLTKESNYSYNNIKDLKRLNRIWYYENLGTGVGQEIFAELSRVTEAEILNNLDIAFVVTEAQYEGLGFSAASVAVTEFPREIAWGAPDQGRTDYPSLYSIADTLIHEVGHSMSLAHSATQCSSQDLTPEIAMNCCNISPSKHDIMSYCRDRGQVDEHFLFKFEPCTLKILTEIVKPRILEGGSRRINEVILCE